MYNDPDYPTWDVYGDIESYTVKRVKWSDFDNIDLYRKIINEKDEQSNGTLVILRFRNGQHKTLLTAYNVYACADNGDTIEKF